MKKNIFMFALCVGQIALPVAITNKSGAPIDVTVLERLGDRGDAYNAQSNKLQLQDRDTEELVLNEGTFEVNVVNRMGRATRGEFTAPEDARIEIMMQDGQLVVRSEEDKPARVGMRPSLVRPYRGGRVHTVR